MAGKRRDRALEMQLDPRTKRWAVALFGVACSHAVGCDKASAISHDAAPAIDAPATPDATDPAAIEAAAEAAFEYGYPLTETMRVCDLYPMVNRLDYGQKLSTPADTNVVRPNNDTLNTSACVYLENSWVEVTMPPASGRYQSLQVFDAYTTTAGVFGPNQVPPAGEQLVLHLRGTASTDLPTGLPVVEVNTPFAYVLFRTLVNGPDDLDAAIAAQSGISLTAHVPGEPPRPMVGSGTGTPGQVFFETLMLRLAQNPPPVQEAGLVASFALAGIRSSTTPTATTATPAQTATWDTAYTQGLAKLTAESQRLSSTRGAWKFPDPNTATPGTDYALRALTARFGLFALPSSESIYPSTGGDGTVAKVLQLPAQLPVDPRGFWSLTMYGSDGFLVSNPIDRYSISDRTPGVQREADGTLKIYLQCSDPGGALTANWLPAPCGAFAMSMRLYLPTAAALDPAFTLPPLN